MKYELNDSVLTIFLEGELNSFSAEDVENEIDAIIKKSRYQSLVIDMAELRYISSAGIRIIVRLMQRNPEFSIANMPDSIYNVFSMVGLSEITKITRLNA